MESGVQLPTPRTLGSVMNAHPYREDDSAQTLGRTLGQIWTNTQILSSQEDSYKEFSATGCVRLETRQEERSHEAD